MNDFSPITPDEPDAGPPPADELDALLQAWHRENADRARQGRDRLVHALSKNEPRHTHPTAKPKSLISKPDRSRLRRIVMTRLSPVAAAIAILTALITFFAPTERDRTYADVYLVPDGGMLNAVDDRGRILGPCPLKHTDVHVEISGQFTRVTVRQEFENPFDDKIEAVYTFPLSHRAAVDSMTMTFDDRVIVGEVHERSKARKIYEAARQQGHVASLLEQERPNIFTQSVANIEPGVEIAVEISYVELLQTKEGECTFTFPMVVGPRYIPSAPNVTKDSLEEYMQLRDGLVLLGPAELTVTNSGDTDQLGEATPATLRALVENATPIDIVDDAAWRTSDSGEAPGVWQELDAEYAGTTREHITLYTNGTGEIGGRCFRFDVGSATSPGTGTTANTSQVPDASRITPRHVRPETRAGHDIAITVEIDSGGPAISELDCALHDTLITDQAFRADGLPRNTTVELADAEEIPNRDFVLTWRPVAEEITEAVFTHTGDKGNFFTLMLQPPARVEPDEFVPRELIFVLDTSGSMLGWPIKKAKEVMSLAIDAMSPDDTFNVITFAGDTHILWDEPAPATDANIETAQTFLENRGSGGGTEMMTAINAALEQTDNGPAVLSFQELVGLPADGREIIVKHTFHGDAIGPVNEAGSMLSVDLNDGTQIDLEIQNWTIRTGIIDEQRGLPVLFTGALVTRDDETIFAVDHAEWTDYDPIQPLRVVCFLTDGEVGNDMAIIDAVRRNAHTTRVFSFGIGNSTNRYLLDGMAQAGRGAVEYVLLEDDADTKIERFIQRIESPVLTNIELKFNDGLDVTDMIPTVVPDLYDEQPIILHGRYTTPGDGTLTIRGLAGDGPYERVLDIELPESEPDHDVIATLWARSKVESIMNRDLAAAQSGRFPPELRQQVVDLGETFGLMTQFTSFVAVEKFHVTIDGEPRLVPVPVELPDGMEFDGACGQQMALFARQLANAPKSIPAAVQQAHDAEMERRRKEALIYATIRTKAEELIEHRAELLRAGSAHSDETIRCLEVNIARANELLAEHGEEVPEIDPPIVGTETALSDPCGILVGPDKRFTNEPQEDHETRNRLKQPIAGINFNQVELEDAIDRLRALTGVNIIPNWPALEASAIEKDAEVTLQLLSKVTAEKALELMLHEVGAGEVDLGFDIHEGAVTISTKDDLSRNTVPNVPARSGWRVDPDQIEQLMSQATELRKNRRFGEAIQILDQVIAIDPNHEQAQWMQETLEDLAVNMRDRRAALNRHRTTQNLLDENDVWYCYTVAPPNGSKASPKKLAIPSFGGRRINLVKVGQTQGQQGGLGGGRFLRGYGFSGLAQNQLPFAQPGLALPGPSGGGVFSINSSTSGQLIDPITGFALIPSQHVDDGNTIPATDMWTTLRANNTTPKQFAAPRLRYQAEDAYSDINGEGLDDFAGYAPQAEDEEDEEDDKIRASIKLQNVSPETAKRMLNQLQKQRGSPMDAKFIPVEVSKVSSEESYNLLLEASPERIDEIKAILSELDKTVAAKNKQRSSGAEKLDSAQVEEPVPAPVTRTYDLQDFAADVPVPLEQTTATETKEANQSLSPIECIAQLIRTKIAPDSWESRGGPGKVQIDQSRLVVTHSPAVHREIRALLGQLRQARFVPVGSEPIVLKITALVKAGDLEAARHRATLLATARPDFKPGVTLRHLLENRTLSPEQINERCRELGDQAAKAIEDKAEQIKRVARRIDEPLLAFMSGVPIEKLDEPVSVRDGGVAVSLLTADKSNATLDALKQAGLTIKSTAKSANVLIGIAPLSKLKGIALVEAVRRIEPIN